MTQNTSKAEFIQFIFQVVGSALSFISAIVITILFAGKIRKSRKEQKPVKATYIAMLNLFICSGLLGLFNFVYHTYRYAIYDPMYFKNPTTTDAWKQALTRILYTIRIIAQFFIIASCTWTVNIAISLFCKATEKSKSFISNRKVCLIFAFLFGYGVPLLNAVFWFVFYQVSIDSKGRTYGNLNPNVAIGFASFYFFWHALLVVLAFIVTSILLITIFAYMRKMLKRLEMIRIMPERRQKFEEYSILVGITFYLFPFLICASWQVYGYMYFGVFYSTKGRVSTDFFYILLYPYSIFYPLQGFLNCAVYAINKKRMKNVLYNLTCWPCKIVEKKQVEEVVSSPVREGNMPFTLEKSAEFEEIPLSDITSSQQTV